MLVNISEHGVRVYITVTPLRSKVFKVVGISMSVGLQRTIHVTTEDHILRRIQVAGLALNVAAIALLSSRLFATTPFKIPFRDWHSIQRLQLYALASAILQQMLDFAVVLLRLLGTKSLNANH